MMQDSANETDKESDTADTVLDEANDLLRELDLDNDGDDAEGGLVIGGFAIDSDDEDEEGAKTVEEQGGSNGDKADKGDAEAATDSDLEHPLSEAMLADPPAAMDPLSAAAAMNNAKPSALVSAAGSPAATATMDRWSQQTSRFASSVASIAKHAASQVAAAGQMAASTAVQPVSVPGVPGYNQAAPMQSLPTAAIGGQPVSADLDKDQKTHLIQKYVGDLFAGEQVIMFLSNLLHVSETSGVSYSANQSTNTNAMWCCVMTYFRLILFVTEPEQYADLPCPPGWDPKCWLGRREPTSQIEMTLASIERVEKTVYQASGSSFMGLVITSKDCGRTLRFSTSNFTDTGRALDSLNTYAFPGRRNLGYLFAFESKRQAVMDSVTVDKASGQQAITLKPTPKRFDAMAEFSRLLQKTAATQSPWSLWPSINNSYQLSATYPSILVGPTSLDESKPESQHIIRQCASFRSEQRLPALTWCGAGGASIWRASQPRVGLQGNRSPADELFLRHIAEAARSANAMVDPPAAIPRNVLQHLTGDFNKDWLPEPSCGIKILDLRPRSSAMANRTGGYGYENTSHYLNSTLQFCNISNIHSIRDSYQRLCSVCNSTSTADVTWNSLVEDTKWLSHIRLILAASWETAYWVHVWRMPVLVHCSHGWDRTSQVCALAQMLLDPYYRTCKGFATLVEKDFMSFGHPFHLRCAHGEGRSDSSSANRTSSQTSDSQASPIFLQFVDCVYQIVDLYPECFEFTTEYIYELSNNIYSCRFGSMLCDTERERELLAGIRQRTYSVWDYLDSLPSLRNPAYKGLNSSGGSDEALLMPLPILLRSVHLWTEKHCRYSPKLSLRHP